MDRYYKILKMNFRVNIDNADWVPPTTRNDARYIEEEEGEAPPPGVKKSRFLRKSRQVELSYKNKEQEPAIVSATNTKSVGEKPEDIVEETEKPAVKTSKNSRGLTLVEFPFDPEDLAPLPRAPPKNIPDYWGWSHSDAADSWYLEANTPSIHANYESFYDDALKKKVVCPKFYSCV